MQSCSDHSRRSVHCRFRTVDKGRVALVVEQEVRWPISRVEVRGRVVILIQPQVITVDTEVDVEPAVAIVVRDGSVGESAFRRSRKSERVMASARRCRRRDSGRAAARFHRPQAGPAGRCCGSPQRGRMPCCQGHPTPAFSVTSSKVPSPRLRYSRFGRPGRLAHVQIVEAIAIVVTRSHTVVAINVDAAGPVQL